MKLHGIVGRWQCPKRFSGAEQKKLNSETSYQEIVKASANDSLMTSKQIEKKSVENYAIECVF